MTIIKQSLPNKKAIFFKLGFVACLLFLGLVSYVVASNNLKGKEAVLGKKTQIQDQTNAFSNNVVEKVQNTADDIKNNAYQLAHSAAVTVGDTATNGATIIKEYILNTTVSNAVKQLDGLPIDVKEKIKESICK